MPDRPYDRKERISSLFMECAASFIRDEANTTPLITVTHVDVSPDLKHATIMVSVFPEEQEKDALIFLKRKGSDFRSFVKRHARLKQLPFFDFSIDYGEKQRQILDKIAYEDAKREEGNI